MNVLLVDDDNLDRRLIKRAINKFLDKHTLFEAGSETEALATFTEVNIGLAIIDYKLNTSKGVDIIKKLNIDSHFKNTTCPVIFVSHDTDEDIMTECIESGAHGFLLKSEISEFTIRRAIIQAEKKFYLESRLLNSYQKAKFLSERDSLTTLPNRRVFDKTLENLIDNNTLKYILIIDIDCFKDINDNYGHQIGDSIILESANRLKNSLSSDQILFRVGGDEFAVVSHSGDKDSAVCISSNIHKNFIEPVKVDISRIYISVSIGICDTETLTEKHSKLDVIRFADIAMYRSKTQGRGNTCNFCIDMRDDFLKSHKLESELRVCLERNAQEIYLQPLANSIDMNHYGFEVLIRFPTISSTKNIEEIIKKSEEIGLIYNLGKWIIERVFIISKEFKKDTVFNINLSSIQLKTLRFSDQLSGLIEAYNIDTRRFVFEITETVIIEKNDTVLRNIDAIKAHGFKLALDDFGTGYSSLSYLNTLPIDIVKFDRSFIVAATDNERSYILLKYINKMLKKIHMKTVAEGIETDKQLGVVRSLDIDHIQGYNIGRPTSVVEIHDSSKLSKKHSSNQHLVGTSSAGIVVFQSE